MRDEAEGLVASVEEAITIGARARAGVPVQISHQKAAGRDIWGLVSESLRLIEAAQARGDSVHPNQYPYTAGSTMLRAILENGAFQPTYPVVSASRSLKMYWSRPDLAGIDTVIVNGISVVRAGEVQRVLPGRVLRRGS